jgi:hypothetical protein
VVTLYELTGGNYRIHRTLSYPEFPDSQIVFDTEVTALRDTEWTTKISVSGKYDGPTDVVSVKDYRLEWSTDGKTLFEKGSATLVTSSGRSFGSVWTSSIVPDKPRFEMFSRGGETVNITFSPFRIDGNKMSYSWQGTVAAAVKQ